MADMMRAAAADVTAPRVPKAAHWIAEERRHALVDGLIGLPAFRAVSDDFARKALL